jgi:hypothetical protein
MTLKLTFLLLVAINFIALFYSLPVAVLEANKVTFTSAIYTWWAASAIITSIASAWMLLTTFERRFP